MSTHEQCRTLEKVFKYSVSKNEIFHFKSMFKQLVRVFLHLTPHSWSSFDLQFASCLCPFCLLCPLCSSLVWMQFGSVLLFVFSGCLSVAELVLSKLGFGSWNSLPVCNSSIGQNWHKVQKLKASQHFSIGVQRHIFC